LIADRAKLMEEIDILKKLKISNGVNGLSKEGDLLSEIIKVDLAQCVCECAHVCMNIYVCVYVRACVHMCASHL
jgi:hypothetical protein